MDYENFPNEVLNDIIAHIQGLKNTQDTSQMGVIEGYYKHQSQPQPVFKVIRYILRVVADFPPNKAKEEKRGREKLLEDNNEYKRTENARIIVNNNNYISISGSHNTISQLIENTKNYEQDNLQKLLEKILEGQITKQNFEDFYKKAQEDNQESFGILREFKDRLDKIQDTITNTQASNLEQNAEITAKLANLDTENAGFYQSLALLGEALNDELTNLQKNPTRMTNIKDGFGVNLVSSAIFTILSKLSGVQ